MDVLVSTMLNYGIGGAMALAVLLFLKHLTGSVIPQMIDSREKDLAWTREMISQQRGEFLAALKEQLQANRESAERLEAHLGEAIEKQGEAIDRLCDEIRNLRVPGAVITTK